MFFVLLPVLFLVLLYLWAIRGRSGHHALGAIQNCRYAHRGLHDLSSGVPENSVPAFQRAVENGFGIELDVHLSKDGQLVIMHDENLQRAAGVSGNISDLVKEDLDQLFLFQTSNHIPYLEDVLTIVAGKVPVIIELKPYAKNEKELVAATFRVLQNFPSLVFCIESFSPAVMYWVRRQDDDVIRGQLSADFIRGQTGLPWWENVAMTFLLYNHRSKPDFIAFEYRSRKNVSLWLCTHLFHMQEVSWTLSTLAELLDAEKNRSIPIFEKILPSKNT